MQQTLIDKGILRPSGEIVKDKINLISGAHTPPFVEIKNLPVGKIVRDRLHRGNHKGAYRGQAEYAELLAEKKKAYAEYAAAKKEMQEVLTAKANVDRLLSPEPEKPEKEKEQARR